LESKKQAHHFNGGNQAVFVTNPEKSPEHEILEASGIYNLTNQPDGARKLTLLPIRSYFRCGNAIMLTIITLGIVPGIQPGTRAFEYDLETAGTVERYSHDIPTYYRVSIWEWFVSRDNKKVLAEALAWSTCHEQPEEKSVPK
jgi:hypothetical protein